MGNRVITRNGANAPSSSDLIDKEIGYSTNEQSLYIRDGNNIVELASASNMNALHMICSSSTPSQTNNILWIDTSDSMFIPKVYYNSEWHALGAVFY